MERRVQCLERIVREQQQEMERLMGMVLTRSPPALEINAQQTARSADMVPTNMSPGYVVGVPNQNFYFHDEVTQANLASDVVGRQAKAKQRKVPIVQDQAWEKQTRGSSFVEKQSKPNALEGAHAFMRALPVQPSAITKTTSTLKTAALNRVPMKQSRAVNAAKDFIDYIANKQVLIAKAANEASSNVGSGYSMSSRTIPQSKSSTAPLVSARRKKILAPTNEINAKKTSLTPERNIDLRNRSNRLASNMTNRTTFVSNADRDNRAGYSRRTTFVSNSDRNTYANNSDLNSFNYDQDLYESNVDDDRDPFNVHPHRNTFANYPDQNTFINYSDRGTYITNRDNNLERNMFVGNSDRISYANDGDRIDYSINSAANTYANNENRNMFPGSNSRSSYSNVGDRNMYMGTPYNNPVAHSIDRNISTQRTDRSILQVNGAHKGDRNMLSHDNAMNATRSIERVFASAQQQVINLAKPTAITATRNTERAPSTSQQQVINLAKPTAITATRNTERAPSTSQQQVINLATTNIGAKRKEKEKMDVEIENSRKKTAAVRPAATAIPESSSSSTSSQSSRSSSQSSDSSRSSAVAPRTHSSSYSSTPSNPIPLSRPSSSQSQSTSSHKSAPTPPVVYPAYSTQYPTAYPSSSSSSSHRASKAVATSPDRRESNFHDMTAEESDDESENDQERQKINKVLTLIQTLSSLPDRQQMAEQLLDKYKTKPAKTKKLINAGKEIFQEWLVEEVLNFSEDTNVKLVEMMLKVTDKATWTPADISRLRVDRTIRQCYKACSALFGISSSASSPCTALINLTKDMWPKYRQMYKMYNSNTAALRNSSEERTYF